MTANSPLVLRIRLSSFGASKVKNEHASSNTKTTSITSYPSSMPASAISSEFKKRPSGMSKEMRRERNRITARESRDRKAMYIVQLEAEVNRLNERVSKLENDISRNTSFIMMDDCPVLLNPEQMGFFDAP